MNEAMVNHPTIQQRLRWRFLCAHQWAPVPRSPLPGYIDATFIESTIQLSFADRLRVLCGGKINLRTMLNTEHAVGKTKTITEARIV